MQNLIVREATEDDARSIAAVQVSSWRDTYVGLVPQDHLDSMSVDERELKWKEILSSGRSKTIVFGVDGTIIGFANFGPARDQDKDPTLTGEITSIYLESAHHGRGFGNALFQKALAYLRVGRKTKTRENVCLEEVRYSMHIGDA